MLHGLGTNASGNVGPSPRGGTKPSALARRGWRPTPAASGFLQLTTCPYYGPFPGGPHHVRQWAAVQQRLDHVL